MNNGFLIFKLEKKNCVDSNLHLNIFKKIANLPIEKQIKI